MTQFWSVNYVCHVCKLKLLFWTIFILIGSYLQLLLNTFYHSYTAIVFRTVLFDTLWTLWKLLYFEENIFIFISLFYSETSNFHNSEIVGRRKLPNPSMNIYMIFNALAIGLQYPLLFKQPDFGLKCLVTIKPKVQSLKFKVN